MRFDKCDFFLLKMEDDQKLLVREIIKEIVFGIVSEIENDLHMEINRPKRLWQRKWISKRSQYEASDKLLKELANEDPAEFYSSMRMTEKKFNELLTVVKTTITKTDTFMRSALTAKVKLEIVLYFLATGCSLRTLSHLFRVSKAAISLMIPEVCDAIYSSLKDHVKVSKNIIIESLLERLI